MPAELIQWTVVLVSNEQAAENRRRVVAGFEVGMIERNPEDQNDTSFALKKSNILNPADESRDFADEVFGQDWFDAVVGKRELAEDVEWLQGRIGQAAAQVALDLTRRWQEGEAPKIRKPAQGETTRANGRVVRVLRRPKHGLLLIYPVLPPVEVRFEVPHAPEPTGLDAHGPPIIGVALSFPTSETTLGVEYRVNRVWGAEMEEDEGYAD